jgi:hypothetical protein
MPRSLKIRQQSTSISMGAQRRSLGSGAALNEEEEQDAPRGANQFHDELESLILAQSER